MGQPIYKSSSICPINLGALPVPKNESIVMGMFNVLEQMWVSRWILDTVLKCHSHR